MKAIISASQAEGREFESRFPLRQKGPGIAGVFCYLEFLTPDLSEGGKDRKQRQATAVALFV